MNDEMRARITAYEELWTRLNAVNGLIADLTAEREDIKTQQRSLANGIISRTVEEAKQVKRAAESRGRPGRVIHGTCDNEAANHPAHMHGDDRFFCGGDVGVPVIAKRG